MSLFECKHPAEYLVVEKDSTEERQDKDFTRITHHLHCMKCHELIDIDYAKLNGGVDSFLSRKP